MAGTRVSPLPGPPHCDGSGSQRCCCCGSCCCATPWAPPPTAGAPALASVANGLVATIMIGADGFTTPVMEEADWGGGTPLALIADDDDAVAVGGAGEDRADPGPPAATAEEPVEDVGGGRGLRTGLAAALRVPGRGARPVVLDAGAEAWDAALPAEEGAACPPVRSNPLFCW